MSQYILNYTRGLLFIIQDQMIAVTLKIGLAWKDRRLSYINLSEGDTEVV
jgi:hypothetical protein